MPSIFMHCCLPGIAGSLLADVADVGEAGWCIFSRRWHLIRSQAGWGVDGGMGTWQTGHAVHFSGTMFPEFFYLFTAASQTNASFLSSPGPGSPCSCVTPADGVFAWCSLSVRPGWEGGCRCCSDVTGRPEMCATSRGGRWGHAETENRDRCWQGRCRAPGSSCNLPSVGEKLMFKINRLCVKCIHMYGAIMRLPK